MRQQVTYNIVTDDGEPSSVTAIVNGTPLTASKDHPNFKMICTKLRSGETDPDTIRGLFDIGHGITTAFSKHERLSERVTVANGNLYFDGEPMHGGLADVIMRYVGEGHGGFSPLVMFLEKIETNPNPHSRDHLWRWLAQKSFSIDQSGDIIGYKKVRRVGKAYESVTAGTAMVNNVVEKGKIPNVPGTIVEMPRSQVTFDPRNGCSTGLHVGTWSYARGFSGDAIIRVKVNPRDVVSVPSDSNDAKMRVCRYQVLDEVTAEDRSGLVLTKNQTTRHVPTPKDEPVEATKPERKPRKAPLKAAKAPAKKAAPKPKPVPRKLPQYLEEYTAEDWESLPVSEARWTAAQWAKDGDDTAGLSKADKATIIPKLLAAATKRKATW